MLSIDLLKFPLSLVQEGSTFCIPASSIAIFKYHKNNYPIRQFDLMQIMIESASDHLPSFGAMVNCVGPKVSTDFKLLVLGPATFSDWLDNIKFDLARQYPILISTRTTNGPHIRVVVQLDEVGGHLVVFNPGIGMTNLLVPGQNGIIGGWSIIQSGLELYSLKQAEDDWNKKDRCGDQLRIEPI